MSHQRAPGKNKVIVHVKPFGIPLGVYTWRRERKAGVVARVGPLGHVQLQLYSGTLVGKQGEGRRGKHGLALSRWGVRGRRRKVTIEIAVHI